MTALGWMRGAIGLLCGLAAGAWCWRILTAPELTPGLARYRSELDSECRALRLGASGRVILVLQLLGCSVLAAGAAMAAAVWPLGLAAVLAVGPKRWLSLRRSARLTALEAQLDSWLLALANALRASPSLGEALASTANIVPPPLRHELEDVLAQWRLGLPLDRALRSAAERARSRTFSAALLTLRIARASGGGVSACLESAAAALREMSRLDAVLRAKTAEGKAQATVIAVVPVPFVAILDWLDPRFLQPLLATSTGHALLALCAALWLAAVLLARRIVQPEL